jgi:hypothetical protein
MIANIVLQVPSVLRHDALRQFDRRNSRAHHAALLQRGSEDRHRWMGIGPIAGVLPNLVDDVNGIVAAINQS